MRKSVAKNSVIDRKYETATAGTHGVKNSNGAQAGMPMFLRRNMSNTSDAILIRRQEAEEEEEVLQTKENDFMQRQAEEEEEEELLQAKLENSVIQRQTNEDEEEEALQTKVSVGSLQRQFSDEEEEMLQSKSQSILQRQAEEEEELQAKLDVGSPDDEYEKEADAVADQVMRMESPNLSSKNVQPAIRRKSTGSNSGTPKLSTGSEQRIQSMRGSGSPLPQHISNDMGSKIGADFSQVGVHTGSDATDLNKEVNARAFTIGNDVFFNSGEYSPESSAGKRLLAHELTHVVQQQGHNSISPVRRTNTGAINLNPPAGITDLNLPDGQFGYTKNGKQYKYIADNRPKELYLPEIRIPNFKQRHQNDYSPLPLIRPPKPRGRGNTRQRENWRSHFNNLIATPLDNKLHVAESNRGFSGDGSERVYFFKGTRNSRLMLIGTREQLLQTIIFPFWDNRQRTRTFQVDHKKEDQLGGEDSSDCTNYELLDAGANGRSGGMISREMNAQVGSALSIFKSPYFRNQIGAGSRRISGRVGYVKQRYELGFEQVRYNLGGVSNGNRFWSTDQIESGEHLDQFSPLNAREVQRLGQSSRTMLFTSPTGGVPIRAPTSSGQRVRIWDRVFASEPLEIIDNDTATLVVDAYKSQADTDLQASYPNMSFYFQKIPGMDAWAINRRMTLDNAEAGTGGVFTSLRLPGLSPIRIDELDLNPAQGFVGRGKLLPTVPLLSQADIDVVVQGADVRLQKTFDFGEVNIPHPFEIYYSSVTAFMGIEGLGLEGQLGFGINRVGEGELQAEVSTRQGLSLSGQFNFDERIFGAGSQAQARMAYQKAGEVYQWSMGGTLTIPEGKVPGVRSATINVDYSEASGFSAQGDAQLDVPGVESGTLSITQSEEEGFIIGGTFSLSGDTPGIRGGSISAQVRERPDGQGYAVSARGEAQPDIPGINSNLIVSYDDGAFTAEITADYARGMLSGEVNAGVTNRTVGEDGQLSETALPDNPLIVYGGGSLTIQIAPWLQGTAGVQFAPNGEITVTGEIGLPDELEIFARREINRSIFNIAVQAPIFPGIVAEIGGGLGATAGIGPGVIDELRLGITYNPAHEEDTTITGDAHLNVPADAGLRVSVRAGIGLGITGASATGGLEIGGTLGIDGVAEAGVHVDWSPASGLDLTANVSVHAQPAFAFDISGYVSVRALGFSVYDETWELASFRFGSDYRFGISLPIHYQEGQPFNISTDDIEFEVPDIDTEQLLKGLISRIA